MEDLGDYFKRHLDLHKKKGTKHFGGMLNASAKKERADKLKEHRKQTRDSLILKRRNIPVATPTPQKPTKQADNPSKRLQMLAEWKAKKAEIKKAQEKKTKPVFKIGVVSAPVGLPNWDNVNIEIKGKKFKNSSFAPENHKFQPPANVKPLYFQNNLKKHPVERSPIATRSKVTKPLQILACPKHESEKTGKSNKSKKARKMSLKKGKMSSAESTGGDSKPSRMPRSKASEFQESKLSNCNTSSAESVLLSDCATDGTVERSPIMFKTPNKQNGEIGGVVEAKRFSLRLTTPKRSAKKSSALIGAQETTSEKEMSSKCYSKKISNNSLNTLATSNPILSEQSTDSQSDADKESVVLFKTPSKPMRNKNKSDEKIKSLKSRVKTPAKKRKFSDEETKPQRITRSKTCDSIESNQLNSTNSSSEYNPGLASPEKSSDNQGSPEVFKTPNKLTQAEQMYISPFVTISRGKDSAKKEFALRKSNAFSPNKDFASHTSPEAGRAYFTRMLDNEISRLEELCEIWKIYKNTKNPPEEACSMIDVVIGQSQLLITKKFEQFRGLIEQCVEANSEKLVTCEDLHGFWDMIYIQVENLDRRFDNLNNLKAADWREVIPEKKKTKSKRSAKEKKVAASSSLREAIKAARMKKQGSCSSDEKEISNSFNVELLLSTKKEKTPQPPLRKSALLSVRSGEKRKSSPGLVMLKVAQMVKDIELGTPAKGILKTDTSKSSIKTRSVLFKDFAEEKLESAENNQNIPNSMTSPRAQAKPVARRSTRLSRHKLF